MLDERAMKAIQYLASGLGAGTWHVDSITASMDDVREGGEPFDVPFWAGDVDEQGHVRLCWIPEVLTLEYDGAWYMTAGMAQCIVQLKEALPALLTDRKALLTRISELEAELAELKAKGAP